MASLSGLNSLYADKLKLRKPGPYAPRQDVFTEFLRNPEALANYNAAGDLWTPADDVHVPNVTDMVAFVLAHVGDSQIDYARLEGDLEAWLGQPPQIQTFRGQQGPPGQPGRDGTNGIQGPRGPRSARNPRPTRPCRWY